MVDDHDVALVAGREHAAVGEADRGRGVAALPSHHPLQRQALGAVARPVREQRRREAGVADRPRVGAPVGEPGQQVLVGEHRADGVERAVHPVEQRVVEERLAVVGEEEVEHELGRVPTLARGARRDALRRIGLVVGRVAELEDPLEVRGEPATRVADLREQPLPDAGSRRARDALVERFPRDLAVRRAAEEGVHRGLQAEHEADGARRDLALDREAVVGGRDDAVAQRAPRRPVLLDRDRDAHRPARGLDHAPHDPELGVEVAEVGHDLDHAAGLGHDGRDPDELVTGGGERRRGLAPTGAVVGRARRGEPERAGGHAVAHDAAHRRDVVGGGGLALRAPLPHHVEAHRAVRHLRADVDVEVALAEEVEVLGEALPPPGQALVEGGAGDVLDTLHELDEAVAVLGPARREPDAAVPHHHRRDAVPRRRHDAVVPGDLAVVVGVDVDEAGHHHGAVGVDHPGGVVRLDARRPRRCDHRRGRRRQCAVPNRYRRRPCRPG